MIITSYSNIDLIQGVIGYGNATEGITDWRIENTGAGIFNINNSSSIIRPSGGTTEIGQITNSSDRYMIFKEGTSTFTVPAGGIVCDILVVGGGGSGGNLGGGGGGGDVIYQQNILFPIGTYNISVGNGGANNPSYRGRGNNGDNSSISGTGITTITAVGGGGGDFESQPDPDPDPDTVPDTDTVPDPETVPDTVPDTDTDTDTDTDPPHSPQQDQT